MTEEKQSIAKTIPTTFRTISTTIFSLLLFEIIFKTATAVLIRPMLSFVLQIMLNISGYKLAFNEKIVDFLFSIPGVIGALLLLILASLIIYYEFAVIILLAYYHSKRERISLGYACRLAFTTLRSLKGPGILGFSLYALVLLPLTNIGITSTLLPQIEIPNFVSGELEKTIWGSIALILLAVCLFLLFLCTIFILPLMVLKGQGFFRSCRQGIEILKAAGKRMIVVILVFFIIWGTLFLLPRYLLTNFFHTPNMDIMSILQTYQFSMQMLVLLLVILVIRGIQFCLMPILLTVIVVFYMNFCGEVEVKEDRLPEIDKRLKKTRTLLVRFIRWMIRLLQKLWNRIAASPFIQKHRKIAIAVLILLLSFGVYWTFRPSATIHSPMVMGHRGSKYGVENTIDAIDGAIESKAEYAEIDIQLSKDGIPIVVHDTNLKRLSGENVNVYDLTAKELGKLKLKQGDYEGTVSTLEKVLKHCDGKIKLVIEYKLHGQEEKDLVDEAMKVVEKQKYQNKCIFLSLDYKLVSQMKENYPKYKTGYCVYGNVGNYSVRSIAEMNIDFLVVEEGMVSSTLISQCKKALIPVYVWTVNDPESMMKYYEMGALGIISDKPDTAMKILNKYKEKKDPSLIYLEDEEG